MEIKDILGIMLLLGAAAMGVAVTCLSHRARAVAFFLMIFGAVVADRLDINFLSRYWYRGSTRGLEFSFVDILAFSVFVSSFLFPRPGFKRWRWPAGLGLMLLFFAYACGATLAFEPRLFGMFELSKMIRGIVFFLAAVLFVRSQRELGLLVLALAAATCFEGALAAKQRWLDGMGRVAGSLDHANSLSMYLCLVAPMFVAAINSRLPSYVRWASVVALVAASGAILLTVSRAGIPIFAFVVLGATLWCISWRITFKKTAAAIGVLLGLAIVGIKFGDDLKERYFESSLAEEYLQENVVESRGYYLRLAHLITTENFFGVGLNNWSYAVSKTYGERLNTPYSNYDDIPADFNDEEELLMNFAAPAHNLAALTIVELGVPGLLIFLLMWLRWFQMGSSFLWRRQRTTWHLLGIGVFFGLVGVFLQSVTEWVFRQTEIYLTVHALAGVLASLYWAKRAARPALARQPAVPFSATDLAAAPAR